VLNIRVILILIKWILELAGRGYPII